MNIPYIFKKCNGCGEWLVASTVNFYKDKRKKSGLESRCKKCKLEQKKQYYKGNRDKILERCKKYREENKDKIAEYYKENKDKILERGKKYYEENKDKALERHKQYREENKEKIAEYHKQYNKENRDKIAEWHKQNYKKNKDKIDEMHKQWYEENKDKVLERSKQYREENKEKIAERGKKYYGKNRDKILERSKQYREENKEKIAEYHKQYYYTPQGQVSSFNSNTKRRLRKQNQGNGITPEQWLECMNFFKFKCAYSGKVLSQDTRSLDHIKPLNQGGDHEIWNCVPMTKSNNCSKHDKDMLQWYKEQPFFSEERLQKIYEWQEYAFNKWHKEEII